MGVREGDSNKHLLLFARYTRQTPRESFACNLPGIDMNLDVKLAANCCSIAAGVEARPSNLVSCSDVGVAGRKGSQRHNKSQIKSLETLNLGQVRNSINKQKGLCGPWGRLAVGVLPNKLQFKIEC